MRQRATRTDVATRPRLGRARLSALHRGACHANQCHGSARAALHVIGSAQIRAAPSIAL